MNIKKSIRNLTIVAVLLAVGWQAFSVSRNHEQGLASLDRKGVEPSFVVITSTDDRYDYERMLLLLAKYKDLKAAYHAKYADDVSDSAPRLDIKELKEVLADFYREKECFERYALRVKYFYKGDVPRKRARSLGNYLKILEKATRDLEKILRYL